MFFRSLAAALAFAAAACATVIVPSTPASPVVTASSRSDRVAGWRTDIAALLPRMAQLHPSLEHSATRAELDAAAAMLSSNVPALSDDEILVGLMRIVARVTSAGCDGHTGLYVWGEGSYPVDSLPLRLWWFDEGVYVVDALPPYGDLVGMRIDTLGGHPLTEILAAIAPLVPKDNDTTVRLLTPRFILIPQVLRGLDLIGDGAVTVTLTSTGGVTKSATVAPIAMKGYNAWAGPYGLHLPDDASVLYLSRAEEPLWWADLDGGTLLYVQYNRVEYLSQSTLEGLRTALSAAHDKVVIDIRHNYGGELGAVAAVLAPFTAPAIDRPGHLFVVAGRNTFSAASMFLARLEAATSAIVVGEPMGGCPNPIGNARPVALSYSGIVVEVGTVQNVAISADDHRLDIPPQLPARLTPTAWLAKEDPALAAIREHAK